MVVVVIGIGGVEGVAVKLHVVVAVKLHIVVGGEGVGVGGCCC